MENKAEDCRHIKGHGYNKKHGCMEIIYKENMFKNYINNCSLTIFKYCPICGERIQEETWIKKD